MKSGLYLIVFLLAQLISIESFGQKKKPATVSEFPQATSSTDRILSAQKHSAMATESPFRFLPIRNIGPSIMSGRVVDVDVNPANTIEFFVAFASGGLWYTSNNGQTFSPLFDKQPSMTIGDIAINWSEKIIWVGTGENNSSRSSYAGTGMYVSKDFGKTWKHAGLADSHHIGRIIMDPKDANHVYVAALGHLYTPNAERGVFETRDGGENWTKRLFINESTGAIDLIIHPRNPSILWAAVWERSRTAWQFTGSGSGSGIYRSDDAGISWTKVSTQSTGFPITSGTGRIGLAVSPTNPDHIYAVLDNQDVRSDAPQDTSVLTITQLISMSNDSFLALNNAKINRFLDSNEFPDSINAVMLKEKVKTQSISPKMLAEYLYDANNDLFETPIKGAALYASLDGGLHWNKTHSGYIDDVFYTYGYYFGQVRVDPSNENTVYIYGVPVLKSTNGGADFVGINGDNVHSDHHALWIDPGNANHLILGNDGGINISYDGGLTYQHCNTIPVGQFYAVTYDQSTPYRVFGGLQDNGVWMGPSTYKASNAWHSEGHYPYTSMMGGDGMQVQVDFRNNDILYTGYQFGNYYRITISSGESEYITPRHAWGERPYRWNWQTPIHLSRHNQDILYMGSHRFHRSLNQGKTFSTLSGDLTLGGKKGNVPFGTLTTIHESPLRFGLLYVGSDDGLIHRSKDGGYTWERVSETLPKYLWVSKVQASAHQEGRVYAALNGYRQDHFDAYVYRSDDFGKTWVRIGQNLPAEPVNVVCEDPNVSGLVYVGTDHGLYVSKDAGVTFYLLSVLMPDVAVHDVTVQPDAKELIIGTHGRSLYVVSLQPVYEWVKSATILALFPFEKDKINSRWGKTAWSKWYTVSEHKKTFYAHVPTISDATLILSDSTGTLLWQVKQSSVSGIVPFEWDYTITESAAIAMGVAKAENGKYYIKAGIYTLTLQAANNATESTLTLEATENKSKRKE